MRDVATFVSLPDDKFDAPEPCPVRTRESRSLWRLAGGVMARLAIEFNRLGLLLVPFTQ